MSTKPIEQRVAEAIVKHSQLAGQAWSVAESQTEKKRAQNLLQGRGKYGPYIVAGDPYQWSRGLAAATIYMEPRGTQDDCEVPFDSHSDGFLSLAEAVSATLGDHYIEFVNAAVASVFSREDVSVPAVVTTYCAKGRVLAEYEFTTPWGSAHGGWEQALFVTRPQTMNIRTDSVAKITIERGKAE